MERLQHPLGGLPGFSNSFRTTGLRSKIWLLLGILGLSLTFIRLIDVSEEFQKGPVLTQVDLKTVSESSAFPAVTLCTLNQISCDKAFQIHNLLKNNSGLDHEQIQGELPKVCRLFKMAGCPTNCSDGDHFLDYNFDDLYNSLLGTTKTVIGESKETTIHEFKYANDEQNFSNFIVYYLPQTGVCFHFNYMGLVKEAGVGEENGMELLIRLNSDPNLREGIQDAKHGLTLTIQRPLAFPTLTLNRLDLEPGMAHLIPLNRGLWNFKKNCISNWSQAKVETFKKKEVMDVFGNIHYDENVCKHYCQLESIYQKCGCIATEHEVPQDRESIFLEANGNLPRSCLLNDSACTTTSTVADPESTCGCLLSCTEETFDMLHSQGRWPADGSWKRIAKRFGISRPIVMATDMINFEEVDIEKYTDFLWRRKVDTSVMKINIFIRSKESLEFSEKDKFESYWEFLAKMGGSMSVFMGLSFVAVIEVWGTYMVWLWSVVSCKMCRKKKTKELFN